MKIMRVLNSAEMARYLGMTRANFHVFLNRGDIEPPSYESYYYPKIKYWHIKTANLIKAEYDKQKGLSRRIRRDLRINKRNRPGRPKELPIDPAPKVQQAPDPINPGPSDAV